MAEERDFARKRFSRKGERGMKPHASPLSFTIAAMQKGKKRGIQTKLGGEFAAAEGRKKKLLEGRSATATRRCRLHHLLSDAHSQAKRRKEEKRTKQALTSQILSALRLSEIERGIKESQHRLLSCSFPSSMFSAVEGRKEKREKDRCRQLPHQ